MSANKEPKNRRLEGLTRGERVAIYYVLTKWNLPPKDFFLCSQLFRKFGGKLDELPERSTLKLRVKLYDKLKEVIEAAGNWPAAMVAGEGTIRMVEVQLKEGDGGAMELLQRFGVVPTKEDVEGEEEEEQPSSAEATEGKP